MGSGGADLNRDPEEGMGAGRADKQTVDQGDKQASDYEYGMGSGRPASEEGMGIIPGKSKNHEGSGGGLKDKIEGMFHHKDK